MSDPGTSRTPGGRVGHAVTIVRDVGPRWAYERTREVLRDEGIAGVLHRGRRSVDTRVSLEARARELRVAAAPESRSAFRRSVLIVSNIAIPQCRFYRVDQKTELLRRAGLAATVVSQDDLEEALTAVQLAGTVILYRVPWSRKVETIVREARRVGATIVFETDDAVYRRDLLSEDRNVKSLPRTVQLGILRGADKFLRAMQESDLTLASTPALADDMARATGRPSFVIANSVDSRMQATVRGILADPLKPGTRPARSLFYGSGSRAHDEDFAHALPGLVAVLRERPDTRLVVAGPVRLPDSARSVADRVLRLEPMTFGSYLRALASMDVSLAPLLPSPFNVFKSDIKLLEATLVGVPSVVSPTVYGDSAQHGVNALVARTPSEWHDAVLSLLEDSPLGSALVDAARSTLAHRRIDGPVTPETRATLRALGLDVEAEDR